MSTRSRGSSHETRPSSALVRTKQPFHNNFVNNVSYISNIQTDYNKKNSDHGILRDDVRACNVVVRIGVHD